nr:tripartite tricarboxylate transporter substrate-binding protein [Cupriavidus basilensis]
MTDVVARVIGLRLGERLGQPVVVENRPGAATIVGAEQVAGASADGYTLLAATNTTLTINPWLYPKLHYDPARSFAPIALIATAPSVIVVNPALPAKTMDELVQLSRARPGSLSYASYGNGSTAHLAGEMLKARAGIDILTRVLAGPWCTQNLADLGAEVIKVERPDAGDETRGWGPPWMPDEAGQARRDSTYYASTNRGKQSITVDFNGGEGQEIIRRMAATCDVLVENYKVGTLARYGLGYEDLREANPGLVYCSVTGYGQTGPYRHRPGYDFVFQGMSGLMSLTGAPDDPLNEGAGGGPQKFGVAVADMATGLYASLAITAALAWRERSGLGQHIDMALLDCALALGSNQAVGYLASGKVPRRYGNAHPNAVPYQVFASLDGKLIVAVGNDGQFAAYCKAIGRPELAADARFAKVSGRLVNRDALLPQLADIMRTDTTEAWLARLEAAGVPCGPINDFAQAFADPQVRHRGIQVELPLSSGGTCPAIASPMRFSATPLTHHRGPPVLGEHTDAVLGESLGMAPEELARLRAAGVI